MKKRMFLLSIFILTFTFCQFKGTASAGVRVILQPWWPLPLVVFPIVPPPGPLPPPPAEHYQSGYLNLDVRPPDTEVLVNGEYRGMARDFYSAPGYLELLKGEYRITLRKKGYNPVSFIVRIIPGQLLTLDVTMDQTKEPGKEDRVYQLDIESTGHLEFDVSPPDAAVYIDGNFYGIASQFREDTNALVLRAGSHHIEIVRPGHSTYVRDINIMKSERRKIKITLDKKE